MPDKVIRLAFITKDDKGTIKERYIDGEDFPNIEVFAMAIDLAIKHNFGKIPVEAWKEVILQEGA